MQKKHFNCFLKVFYCNKSYINKTLTPSFWKKWPNFLNLRLIQDAIHGFFLLLFPSLRVNSQSHLIAFSETSTYKPLNFTKTKTKQWILCSYRSNNTFLWIVCDNFIVFRDHVRSVATVEFALKFCFGWKMKVTRNGWKSNVNFNHFITKCIRSF